MKIKKSEILEDYSYVGSIMEYCNDGDHYKDFQELAKKYKIKYEENKNINKKHNMWILGDELLYVMTKALIGKDTEVEL